MAGSCQALATCVPAVDLANVTVPKLTWGITYTAFQTKNQSDTFYNQSPINVRVVGVRWYVSLCAVPSASLLLTSASSSERVLLSCVAYPVHANQPSPLFPVSFSQVKAGLPSSCQWWSVVGAGFSVGGILSGERGSPTSLPVEDSVCNRYPDW